MKARMMKSSSISVGRRRWNNSKTSGKYIHIGIQKYMYLYMYKHQYCRYNFVATLGETTSVLYRVPNDLLSSGILFEAVQVELALKRRILIVFDCRSRIHLSRMHTKKKYFRNRHLCKKNGILLKS